MSITRKTFFSGLAALFAAKAQTIITPCRPKIQWGNPPPLCNGQCPNPECDYWAPPWRISPPSEDQSKYRPTELKFARTQPTAFYTNLPDAPDSPIRIVRCPNCNTAFWQDPEPEAK